MAEGGSFQTTVDGSEIVYDYNCSVCIRKKSAYSEAAYYCPECNEYFCKQCFFHFGCDHGAIGRAKMDNWRKSSHGVCFDECPRHKTNTIQLYCPREDVVCCAVCGQTDHKNCGDLQYIPLIVSGENNKEYLKRVQDDLEELKTTTEQLLKDRTARLAALEGTHKKLTEDIREVKSKIVAALENLEHQALKEAGEFKADCDRKFKLELKELDDIKSQLSAFLSKVCNPNLDDSLLFARLKQGKELVQNKSNIIFDMSDCKISDQAQFIANTKLDEFVKDLQGLGVLVTDTTDKQQTEDMGKVSKGAHDHGPSHQSLKVNKPYTVKQKASVNVRIKEDQKTCDIYGMCKLPNDNFIVTDFNNRRLKQLDSTYKVTSHCSLSNSPRDVCNTEAGEVAVGLRGKTIQFVSVGDKMTATHSFCTSNECYSLAHYNKCLYVVCSGSILYVYNRHGTLLRTISTDQHGKKLFSDPRHIAFSPLFHCIYVSDADGLVTVDLDGILLATFKPRVLPRGAHAVCVDGVGNVFVGDWSNKVLQVAQEGNGFVAQIMSKADRVETFKLCFDIVNTRLLVSSLNSDTVTVLQLSQ